MRARPASRLGSAPNVGCEAGPRFGRLFEIKIRHVLAVVAGRRAARLAVCKARTFCLFAGAEAGRERVLGKFVRIIAGTPGTLGGDEIGLHGPVSRRRAQRQAREQRRHLIL